MTVLVGALALLVSALGGWFVTAGVLRLAARFPGERRTTGPGAPAIAPGADVDVEDAASGGTPTRTPTDAPTATDDEAAAGDAGPESVAARSRLRGGTWIGVLERLAITGLVVIGQPALVAVVVAIKGLGRFSEIKGHPDASERFVIGTLASMTWAGAVGFAAAALV